MPSAALGRPGEGAGERRERAHPKVRERTRAVRQRKPGRSSAAPSSMARTKEEPRVVGPGVQGEGVGCGERIRTSDLRVMSPTSCRCSTPRPITLGPRGRSGQTRSRIERTSSNTSFSSDPCRPAVHGRIRGLPSEAMPGRCDPRKERLTDRSSRPAPLRCAPLRGRGPPSAGRSATRTVAASPRNSVTGAEASTSTRISALSIRWRYASSVDRRTPRRTPGCSSTREMCPGRASWNLDGEPGALVHAASSPAEFHVDLAGVHESERLAEPIAAAPAHHDRLGAEVTRFLERPCRARTSAALL